MNKKWSMLHKYKNQIKGEYQRYFSIASTPFHANARLGISKP